MQIISINTKGTKSAQEAAFNVTGDIDMEAFNRIEYGVLRLSLHEGVLFVRAPANERPIDAKTIAMIQTKYEGMLSIVNDERKQEAERIDRMLKQVRQSTQLPLDDRS